MSAVELHGHRGICNLNDVSSRTRYSAIMVYTTGSWWCNYDPAEMELKPCPGAARARPWTEGGNLNGRGSFHQTYPPGSQHNRQPKDLEVPVEDRQGTMDSSVDGMLCVKHGTLISPHDMLPW